MGFRVHPNLYANMRKDALMFFAVLLSFRLNACFCQFCVVCLPLTSNFLSFEYHCNKEEATWPEVDVNGNSKSKFCFILDLKIFNVTIFLFNFLKNTENTPVLFIFWHIWKSAKEKENEEFDLICIQSCCLHVMLVCVIQVCKLVETTASLLRQTETKRGRSRTI